MRFLADENIDPMLIDELRQLGHDVVWVGLSAPGSATKTFLRGPAPSAACSSPNDKDFGALVFQRGLAADSGVILLRTTGPAETQTRVCVDAIGTRDDWSGLFAVVENDGTRIRRVPSADIEPG